MAEPDVACPPSLKLRRTGRAGPAVSDIALATSE